MAATSEDYKRSTIEGILCIVWNPINNQEDSKVLEKLRKERRKLKDLVSIENKDIFMLDICNGGTVKEKYCDAIVATDKLNAWNICIEEYYKKLGYVSERKPIKTGLKVPGHSIALKRVISDVLVTILLYPKKNKIMVQPEHKDEANVLEWIRSTKCYLQKVLSTVDTPTPASEVNQRLEGKDSTTPMTCAAKIHHHHWRAKRQESHPPFFPIHQHYLQVLMLQIQMGEINTTHQPALCM